MRPEYLAILLAAMAAPGFWELIKAIIEKVAEVFTGRKKATLDEIAQKMDAHQKDIDTLKTSFVDMRDGEAIKDAQAARRRILRFNDELLLDVEHSKEYFDDILSDVDIYERYCSEHPEFPNGKTVMATENIRTCYKKCTQKHSFLGFQKK